MTDEAARFTSSILGPEPTAFYRTFHDSIRNPTLYPGHKYSGPWPEVSPLIQADQQLGYGAFMVINGGGQTDSEITHHRACFIDVDIHKGDPVPRQWHLAPHLITERRDKAGTLLALHAYWLTQGDDLLAWMGVQKQLIAHYQSDRTVFNPSRVMRIPGTFHLKDGVQMYRLAWVAPETGRYDLATISHGLPDITNDPAAQFVARGEVLLETDDDQTVMRVKSYLLGAQPAVEGEHGDQHTFAVAARCREEGLSAEKTLELLWEVWNPKCEPPWDYTELQSKVYNAYAYAQKPQGSSNAHALFTQLAGGSTPTTPDPLTFGESVAVAVTAEDTAEIVDPAPIGGGLYEKNHSVNAAQFLVSHYPGQQLMRVQSDFYVYNGKVWDLVEDEFIKYQLTIAMLGSNPSDSIINGTFNVLCKLCYTVKEIGDWPGHDTSNYIAYENGVLDALSMTLHPHSQDFFCVSMLPYAFDPNAKCPRWRLFVGEVFGGDQELAALLQEWLGYQLIPSNAYQKAMLMIGQRRSGKGTIGRIMEDLVGPNGYAGVTLSGLADNAVLESVTTHRTLFIGDAHSISGLHQATVLDRFLSITGGDQLSIPRKYKSAWRGRLPGRFTLAANAAPRFIDDSGAMSSRFMILPFAQSWLGREDLALHSALYSEIEGISLWALEGLHRLLANGFTKPAASLAEQQELAVSYSPLHVFVEECCEMHQTYKVTSADLYGAYRAWAMTVGTKPQARNGFIASMRAAFRGSIEKRIIVEEGRRSQGFWGLRLSGDSQAAANVVSMPQLSG